ncbi:MAG: hypothetical protein SP4CHLAM5_02780 [Chlamydiia bacterium]|nr:hypothetical protein [Chlamydiia bacterium]MCH9618152.1 hypothetical protein [Chlamydiia bacterium]MCH9624032.1 hypothetical protein [Chlamydiia bacterium]
MKYTCLLLLLLAGCTHPQPYTDQVSYHDNGLAKPKVAIVKVIDSSDHKLDWDLSSELTELFIKQLFSDSKFYLTDDFHMLESQSLKNLEISPYSEDMRWLKEMNSNSEFVVFTEILEHNIENRSGSAYNPLTHIKDLSMSVRVRVLDIRKTNPKIVLQEVITKVYSIPFNFGTYSDQGGSLAKNTFSLSPLGIAHKNILYEISKEVEEYIIIARSNIYD